MQFTTPSLNIHSIVQVVQIYRLGHVANLVNLSAGMLAEGHHLAWILTSYTISKNNMFLHKLLSDLFEDLPFAIE